MDTFSAYMKHMYTENNMPIWRGENVTDQYLRKFRMIRRFNLKFR